MADDVGRQDHAETRDRIGVDREEGALRDDDIESEVADRPEHACPAATVKQGPVVGGGVGQQGEVRARAIPTAIITKVSVIAAPVTLLVAIQVASGWLNRCSAPIEKALRAAMLKRASASNHLVLTATASGCRGHRCLLAV